MSTRSNCNYSSKTKRPIRSKKTGKPIVHGPVDSAPFCVLAAVARAMKAAGEEEKRLDEMFKRAMSGDYNHLLVVCLEYVDFRI